jgi:gamma-glutamylcyclotransferase (GGCT)/AIG2-like uncharacterized protein YtfP
VSTFNLFVYGTLRSAYDGTRILLGCELLGTALVHGILYDIDGRFPALVLYSDQPPVHGEVWRCPASLLPGLDQYENIADGMFRRVAVEAETVNGALPCWVYAAGPLLSHKLTLERRVASGDWQPARA